MASRHPNPPVCVTGAGGYLGSFIVSELLRNGYDVHGTVRDPSDTKNAFLSQLGDADQEYELCGVSTVEPLSPTTVSPKGVGDENEVASMTSSGRRGHLTLFAADLGTPGSFHAAVEGCEVLIHTASLKEETSRSSDPQQHYIEPMLAGTKNVVEACTAHGVRRIVFTSSAVTVLQSEASRDPSVRGKPFTEDEWVPHLSATYGTYAYTKIECEKLLGRLWSRELISLLPPAVVGPLFTMPLPDSHTFLKSTAAKEFGSCFSFPGHARQVDVRDVARGHLFAAFEPSLPSGRYTLCAPDANGVHTETLAEVFNQIDERLQIPTRTLPKWLPRLVSICDDRLTPYILTELLPECSSLDVSRLQKHGFVYQHDLVAMLRASLATYRKHGIMQQ